MTERRIGEDRRSQPTPALSFFSVMGRRQVHGRREGDGPGYVDLYHPLLFFILISIILLSVADAYLTLDAISAGARELNPAMRGAIGLGKAHFIAIKIVVTGFGVVLLCMHKSFTCVRWIILTVLAGYIALIGYHLYLLQFR